MLLNILSLLPFDSNYMILNSHGAFLLLFYFNASNKKGEVVSHLGTPSSPDVTHCSFFLTAVSFSLSFVLCYFKFPPPPLLLFFFIPSTSCPSLSPILPAVTSLFACPHRTSVSSTSNVTVPNNRS